MSRDFMDESSIELELNKLNRLKIELEAVVKSKKNNEDVVEEITSLKQSIEKAILRRRIQLKLIALKKHMQLIEALKDKLYLFNRFYSRFLEEKLKVSTSPSYSAEEVMELPSSDEIKEKLYEIKARYLELINNDLIKQEDVSET
ncbi:MAG: hypothetical protein HA495_00635 [Thaumarchaeota archaeon]|nr:hypothetical protein [Nitrososphaerota archaeon]